MNWIARTSPTCCIGVSLFGFAAALGLLATLPAGIDVTGPHQGLGLGLAGISILAAHRRGRAARLVSLLLALVVGIDGAIGLVRDSTDLTTWPGPLNLGSALSFVLFGITVISLQRGWALVSQLAATGLAALTIVDISGHLLSDSLFGAKLTDTPQISLSTAIAMLVLCVGIVGAGIRIGRWRAFYHERDDRRITAIGVLIVMASSLFVGIAVVNLTARAMLLAYDEAMMAHALDSTANVNRILRLATRDIEASLAQQHRLPPNLHCAELFERIESSMSGRRLLAMRLDLPGQPPGIHGTPTDSAALRIPLKSTESTLIWTTSPRLSVTRPLTLRNGQKGSVTIEVNLNEWSPDLFREGSFGATGETLYCAAAAGQIHCLPTRTVKQPFIARHEMRGQKIPMARALEGDAGVTIAPDYRGVIVKAAYVPIVTDLGVVQKIDIDEVMEPAWRWLWRAALVVMFFMIGGGWLLYRSAYPLAWALRKQQLKFQGILDHAPSAIVTATRDGEISSFNAQAASLFGLSGPALALRRLGSLFDHDAVTDFLATASSDQPQRLCCNALTAAGQVVPVFVRLSVQELDGQRHLIAVVDDISDRVEREIKLERWESAFMHTTWGIALGSPDSPNLVDVNPAFAQMHGYTREELIGRPIAEVFAPTARNNIQRHIDLAHQSGEHTFESMHLRRDGTEFPARIDISVVYDSAGQVRMRIVNVQDISHQSEIETRLRESEQIRRLVLDTQRDMICRWDMNARIVYINRSCAELFGEPPETILGRLAVDVMSSRLATPEKCAELESLLRELTLTPRRVEAPFEMRHPIIGRIWVQWSILPLYQDGRVLNGFQISGHDITARKAAESALVESESWFRGVFDSMFHYAAVLAPSGHLRTINQRAVAFLGMPAHQLAGMLLWELDAATRTPGSAERLRDAIKQAATGQRILMEIPATAHDGQRVIFDFSLRPILDKTGTVAHLIAEAHDITEYRNQQRSIEERDARFQNMAESMPGIAFEFVRDAGGAVRVRYVNRTALRLCGLGDTDFDPRGVSIFDCLHPDEHEHFLKAVAQSEQNLTELQWVGRLNSPDAIWLDLRAIPRQIDGEVVWSGVGLDITDMKQKEFEIEQSRTTLRELSFHHEAVREDERRRMAREIHDELGQNLTALRMGLAVLGERARETALLNEALRLKGIVDQSITVVRGIATTLRPAAMDLGIAAALRWLANEFETNVFIRCTVDVDGNAAQLDNDRATGLFRIAQESLTNVARHASAIHVWIRMRRINRHFVLEVGDDGCGFDSHSRTSGYGLLGMKERALSLGGEMIINSKPGDGTVISIHIPAN